MKKGLNRIRELERQNYANYLKFCEEQFLSRHLYTRLSELQLRNAPAEYIERCEADIAEFCGLGA